jgi:L-lysine exporter family protein LysE/ArgO
VITVALTGYLTAFSLILAIGAQNAFVLRQGLIGQHVFAICLFCAVSDAILISAGVAGFGWIVTLTPSLPRLMALATGLGPVLLTGAALTWLNPHVYLDTLALIGAVSTRFVGAEKLAFALAAMASSFSFFFALGYGAKLLTPLMQRPGAWRLFDAAVGATMWAIAAGLIASAV